MNPTQVDALGPGISPRRARHSQRLHALNHGPGPMSVRADKGAPAAVQRSRVLLHGGYPTLQQPHSQVQLGQPSGSRHHPHQLPPINQQHQHHQQQQLKQQHHQQQQQLQDAQHHDLGRAGIGGGLVGLPQPAQVPTRAAPRVSNYHHRQQQQQQQQQQQFHPHQQQQQPQQPAGIQQGMVGIPQQPVPAITKTSSAQSMLSAAVDKTQWPPQSKVNEKKHPASPSAMTPQQTLLLYEDRLSPYEKQEIHQYKDIYFVGTCGTRKIAGNQTRSNNGYDDERGDYLLVQHDHLAYRYEIQETLGKGSFGAVVKCIDYATGQHRAVKIIRNKKRFHTQARIEVRILHELRTWDPNDTNHTVVCTDAFCFRSHLCVVFELLSINLYEHIRLHKFQGFDVSTVKIFARQLLIALRLLKRNGVVHCDLKPENVLLVSPNSTAIKVIDFGSSCFESERVFTYIQSRFYRSPEVILGLSYCAAIDMWSLGCILAELATGYPLFPGENEVEQLACITEILGPPPNDLIQACTRKKLFFDSAHRPRVVTNSRGRRRTIGPQDLAKVLRCEGKHKSFVHFVSTCLEWNPAVRLTPEQGLAHPWITDGSG